MQTMLTGFSNKMPPDSSLNNPVSISASAMPSTWS